MKKVAIALSIMLAACGYTAKNNEATGQVKKVTEVTPIVCSDYTEVDLSLGVMRNGVGSMSHEDMVFLVENTNDVATLKTAAANGSIVTLTYDTARVRICVPKPVITSIKIETPAPAEAAK